MSNFGRSGRDYEEAEFKAGRQSILRDPTTVSILRIYFVVAHWSVGGSYFALLHDTGIDLSRVGHSECLPSVGVICTRVECACPKPPEIGFTAQLPPLEVASCDLSELCRVTDGFVRLEAAKGGLRKVQPVHFIGNVKAGKKPRQKAPQDNGMAESMNR